MQHNYISLHGFFIYNPPSFSYNEDITKNEFVTKRIEMKARISYEKKIICKIHRTVWKR